MMRGYMMNDEEEWKETFELIEDGHETVQTTLVFGSFITLTEELFKKMIEEINDSRIKNGDIEEGVELIVVSEAGDADNVSAD